LPGTRAWRIRAGKREPLAIKPRGFLLPIAGSARQRAPAPGFQFERPVSSQGRSRQYIGINMGIQIEFNKGRVPVKVWTRNIEPEAIRQLPVTIKEVKKEGDDLFLNFIEYHLLFGTVPVKLTLGYHRKLKNLKIVIRKKKKDYEFIISGAQNPETGEFTRWIEGKNYAYFFKHILKDDLVKASFISSLFGQPIVPMTEALKSLEFVQKLFNR
jgi:hypothetical protein